jgi:hypothetical protein
VAPSAALSVSRERGHHLLVESRGTFAGEGARAPGRSLEGLERAAVVLHSRASVLG